MPTPAGSARHTERQASSTTTKCWLAPGVGKALIVGRKPATWPTAADRPPDLQALVIEHRFERQTCLVRQAAAERPERQVIDANVDVVGIVCALGDGNDPGCDLRLINENRLSRYLGAVAQSRARPLLIVNKSDLSRDPTAIPTALPLNVSVPYGPATPGAVIRPRTGSSSSSRTAPS